MMDHHFTYVDIGCHADGAFGHTHVRARLADLVEQVGAPAKFAYESVAPDPEVVERVTSEAADRVGDALRIADKEERGRTL